jgi:hypothetical protein
MGGVQSVERLAEMEDIVIKKRKLRDLGKEIEILKQELAACRNGVQAGGFLYWLWRRGNLDSQIKALEEEKARIEEELRICKNQAGGARQTKRQSKRQSKRQRHIKHRRTRKA